MSDPVKLLAECDARGIRLCLADDSRLSIDAPQATLTPDLLEQLKAYKAELLTLLEPVPVCRCGSTTWRDVSIHEGQSVRRDCKRCGRFLDFPIWYGKNTLQNEKYPIECQYDKKTN